VGSRRARRIGVVRPWPGFVRFSAGIWPLPRTTAGSPASCASPTPPARSTRSPGCCVAIASAGVQAGVAFDALVAAYRQLTPRLAGFGQGGEWPADTARLRARLVALVEGTAGPLPIVSGLELWSTQPRGRPRTPR
jgi:hypothetical protein